MEKEAIQAKMKSLVDLVIMHDKLYEENKPIITDSEYDELYFELVALEKKFPEFVLPYSPTRQIYTQTVDSLKKVKHAYPMLSQDKATTLERIEDWMKQSTHSSVVVQHKMDGLTLVLTYDGGVLLNAVTRGNGEVGEDVTHNALSIPSIPKQIVYKEPLVVRGEVVVPFDEFKRINVDGKYSNPRNLASGTLRQLDAGKSSRIGLQFVAFDIANKYSIESLNTETGLYAFLTMLGFTVVSTWAVSVNNGIKRIQEILDEISDSRPTLPFMIDGAVLKFNLFKSQEELGYTSKFPKWAIAFKFKSLDASTKLLSVDWQIGKSGQITPVANFNPVDIDGVTISRATLHNYQNIVQKDIRVNDTIIVARANDVIPYIQQSVKGLRDGTEIEIPKPITCPHCGQPLVDEMPLIHCVNPNCVPQIKGRIVHWASRDALNITSLGEAAIHDFYDNDILSGIGDLYTALPEKKDVIVAMEGYGEKKYQKIIEAIEESKKATLSSVIYGLSIEQVGLSTAKDLAKEFLSMREILRLMSEDLDTFLTRLKSIDGIAGTVTESLLRYFGCWQDGKAVPMKGKNENVELITSLLNLGMTMEEPSTRIGDGLKNKTFVITGTLSKPRNDFQKEIESLGGKISGSVSKKTDYLLVGESEENSSKYLKAKELGVIIITESQYNELIR